MLIKARVHCDNSDLFTKFIDITPIYHKQQNLNNYCGIENGHRFLDVFQDKHRVPDVLRYVIEVSNKQITVLQFVEKRLELSVYNDYLMEQNNNECLQQNILLVLESPHRDEYYHDKRNHMLIPKAPAQGKTGKNIENFLGDVLGEIANSHMLDDGYYRFIIVNPIPYQCSLAIFYDGKLKATVRNRVWRGIWTIPCIQCNFNNRIRSYNPKLIINCCTSQLQKKVSDVLFEKGFQSFTVTANHPSDWTTDNFNLKFPVL